MANQIAIASTVMGVAEGLSYARRAGLDGEAVIAALAPGAAGSFQLNALGPKMLAGDFAPGFMVKHFLKDLGIAIAEAEAMGLDLPGLAQSRRLFERVAAARGGEAGTQAIRRWVTSNVQDIPATGRVRVMMATSISQAARASSSPLVLPSRVLTRSSG
jgi:3-hydroxyisobutyrate dehydrogenase